MNRGQLVSVVITTKNEEKVIGTLINSIRKQTYKKWDIILVDNNSTDETVEIAERMGVLVYNFGPERSAQRNFGAKKSKGKYLLFLDADMLLTKEVIEKCVKLAEDEKNAALVIPEKSYVTTFWEKAKAFERLLYNLDGDSLTDAARFFKKEVFIKVGGYDEEITGPEDWDLTETIKKSGYKIGRVKKYIYHRERIKSLYDVVRKKYYYALRVHRYLDKHQLPLIGPKTIYFLRPVFYKNFDKFIAHPILSIGMILVLFAETLGGGLGYFIGRIRKL